jgi:pantoate--beta-alanine ligase
MNPTDPLVLGRVPVMQAWADAERAAGRLIALVPTMGALHDGHLSLVRIARSHADRVIVSVFVNPTQFGPGEDYARYPRDLAADLALLRRVHADVVFAPEVADVYPPGNHSSVAVAGLVEGMCGRGRPGHFAGVTNVVARLFHACRPHVAVFGEKDYQQLVVVRRMARDLLFGIEVLGGPTVREPDGLAKSSRNAYLSPEGRTQATALNAGLLEARQLFRAGERDARRLAAAVRDRIEKEPLAAVEYVELRDAETLEEMARADRRAVLAVAARFEGARLIDNTILEEEA